MADELVGIGTNNASIAVLLPFIVSLLINILIRRLVPLIFEMVGLAGLIVLEDVVLDLFDR